MSDGAKVGYVAIGRNEGARLKRCLAKLREISDRVAYVDSDSQDGSPAFARTIIECVVELTPDRKFTAARSRNAGFAALMAEWPDTDYVMFIDGDCELVPEFAPAAVEAFQKNEETVIVTGRCRELNRNGTLYNRLCDMEWDGPIGEIEACGGIFMVRPAAFRAAKGFNEDVIAAEDDEFCIRCRRDGGKIVRIDQDMCFHDADIRSFGQWWRRSERAGYAFSQVGDLHPGYFAAPRRRAWIWGLALPAIAVGFAPFTSGFSLILFGLYLLSYFKTLGGLVARGASLFDAGLYAGFLTLSKFPTLVGILNYRWKKSTGRRIGLVEYK